MGPLSDNAPSPNCSKEHNHSDEDIKPSVEKRRRVRLSKRDLNAPKKPSTSYTLFLQDVRPQLLRDNPSMSVLEQSKTIGARWRQLSEEEKVPYVERARQLRDAYVAALKDYQQSDAYRNWLERQKALKEIERQAPQEDKHRPGDIAIFSKEFLAHNKASEAELRAARTRINALRDEQTNIRRRIELLRGAHLQSVDTRSGIDAVHGAAKEKIAELAQRLREATKGINYPEGVLPNELEDDEAFIGALIAYANQRQKGMVPKARQLTRHALMHLEFS